MEMRKVGGIGPAAQIRGPAFHPQTDRRSSRGLTTRGPHSPYGVVVNLDAGMHWAGAHPFAVDSSIAAVLSVMAQIQIGSGTPMLTRLLLLGVTAVVAGRRRAPLLTCLAVGVLVAAMALTENPPSV